MSPREIYITEKDMDRLRKLLADFARDGYRPDLASLQAELSHAQIVPSANIPGDVITMNSEVVLRDLKTRENVTYTLVFPEDASFDLNRISVLAPIGTAMLGHKKGDTFEWPVPSGMRKLKVKEILFQPEAAGQLHL